MSDVKKYSHGLKAKMRDREYCKAVSSLVRSVVVGLSVLALFVVVCYVLMALPGLKASSLTRIKRLKENALNKACIPPSAPTSDTDRANEVFQMCVTPHGVLRCNQTMVEPEKDDVKRHDMVCDEETMYYRGVDVEYEARVEALLRLVHLEARICGPACVRVIEIITDDVTDNRPLSVCVLTLAMLVIEWSILDCHRGRKRVRAALDVLATKPPSFLYTNEKQD